MTSEILKTYNRLLFNKVSSKEHIRLLKDLHLLSLSLYLKNLTNDTRSLKEIKLILQEEFNDIYK